METFRYYVLFQFFIRDPQHAATVKEKITIALLRETQTLQVVGCNDPDKIDASAVWQHLQQYKTAVGTVPKGGPVDSALATRFRALNEIDMASSCPFAKGDACPGGSALVLWAILNGFLISIVRQ